VPPSSADTLRRVPFAPVDAEVIAGFCAANGGIDYARLLLDLTSGAGGVFVIADDEGIALAATVVDRTRNAANSANLEMLAVRARIPAAEFIRLVIEPAAAFAREGDRRALHVTLPRTLWPADEVEEALLGAGLAHAYDVFEMRRPGSAPPAPAEPLPGSPRHLRSISMFSLVPLLETANMMPRPTAMTRPITVHVVPTLCRTPICHNAARTPPINTTKPTR